MARFKHKAKRKSGFNFDEKISNCDHEYREIKRTRVIKEVGYSSLNAHHSGNPATFSAPRTTTVLRKSTIYRAEYYEIIYKCGKCGHTMKDYEYIGDLEPKIVLWPEEVNYK
ncbi:MAG: hypothetical protein DRP03_02675 [Candidatus Aenigmatarchaeota archaeon]|nr:MAG: hypothetical protein DRP03_02675 [Candidatus Aenigmarchaeota archaeon]